MKEEKQGQIEELVEEVEKKKINIGKLFLCTLFVLFSLVGVFFLATYIRWKAEISDKTPILYRGQEEIKIDKLIDFYGIELSTDLKEDEAIYMYCTSQYGKNCIMPNYSSLLENNFREPLTVINVIVFIDLVLIYILVKDSLNGKKRTYIYGTIILLWGLFGVGKVIYNATDYFLIAKDSHKIPVQVEKYLRSDYKDKYIPVFKYSYEDIGVRGDLKSEFDYHFIDSFIIEGEFKQEEVKIYYDSDFYYMTKKGLIFKNIVPATAGILTTIMGFVYLTINKRFKKKEAKKEQEEKEKNKK